MTLLPDWKQVIRKAWSVKFMVLAALLSGCEVAVSILQPAITESLPPGVFASLAGLVTAGALVARVLAQTEAATEVEDASPEK
jgi:protein-S-isoprenylcysteine O-methyltransferase Ste14